jgi:hypothetical protein
MKKPLPPAKPAPRAKITGDKEKGIRATGSAITKPVSGNELTFDKSLPTAKVLIADGLQQLTACVAMKGLTVTQVREVFDYTKGVEDAVKEAAGFARVRVLDLILREGESTGTSGESKKITYPDGRTQTAKCQKTGTDPKKFEAALRAKSVEVVKYMVPDIKYKMPSDYDAAKQAVDDGVFSEDEMKLLAYEPSYAVERSKESKE